MAESNNKLRNSREDSFELKVFIALKAYGYLFPSSVKDVENFDVLYGKTEIDVPQDLFSKSEVYLNQMNANEDKDIDFSLNRAALKRKNKNLGLSSENEESED